MHHHQVLVTPQSGQLPQPLHPVWTEEPQGGLPEGSGVLTLGGRDGVQPGPQQLIGVATGSGPAELPDVVDHLGRPRAVERQIPAVHHQVRSLTPEVVGDGVQRPQVAMHIRQDRDSHGDNLRSFGTGFEPLTGRFRREYARGGGATATEVHDG